VFRWLFPKRVGFTTTDVQGRRRFTWRIWVLIWLFPGVFAAGALAMAYEDWRHTLWPTAEGEVVRVYAWEGTSVLDYGEMGYSPVFRYIWSNGQPTEATAGMRHADWNFPLGTRRTIHFNPKVKDNVFLPGPHVYMVAKVLGLMALALAVPALWLHRRARRWERRQV
jgi:hypothetical protein